MDHLSTTHSCMEHLKSQNAKKSGIKKSGGKERPESSFVAFRAFLSSCDLFYIKHTCNFISRRVQKHSHLVHCHLDRTIGNNAWSDLFPRARSHYLIFEASDHRHIISTLDSKKKKSVRLFRYNRTLCDNLEITQLVKEIWNTSSACSVADKITRCRQAISTFSNEFYVNIRKLVQLKDSLDAALSASLPDDDSSLG
ncbi:hypothetical protein Bca52824_065462 [Brassica carinata]|uniref:Uncharacterized protein n=1 Tax=Brassica carinata TaxID=52824 RepID=A0A8X7QIT4_BRACI|nr:hypothetical protein Bca52824_065462 [Brassica carinata]